MNETPKPETRTCMVRIQEAPEATHQLDSRPDRAASNQTAVIQKKRASKDTGPRTLREVAEIHAFTGPSYCGG